MFKLNKGENALFFDFNPFTMSQTFYVLKEENGPMPLTFNTLAKEEYADTINSLCTTHNIKKVLISCDENWFNEINQDLTKFKYIETERV